MTTEIIIVRQPPPKEAFTAAEVDTFRRVLYALADGMNAQHKQRWRRLWNWLWKAGPGEFVTWTQTRTRSSPFHRRHMLIEQRVFDAQERFEEFEQFRNWLKLGSGFCDWYPGPKGAVVPVPKSMSYAALDEDGMQELHVSMMRFLRVPRTAKVLWPHLGPAAGARMIESTLEEFRE